MAVASQCRKRLLDTSPTTQFIENSILIQQLSPRELVRNPPSLGETLFASLNKNYRSSPSETPFARRNDDYRTCFLCNRHAFSTKFPTKLIPNHIYITNNNITSIPKHHISVILHKTTTKHQFHKFSSKPNIYPKLIQIP